jgi:hypothetical protein
MRRTTMFNTPTSFYLILVVKEKKGILAYGEVHVSFFIFLM